MYPKSFTQARLKSARFLSSATALALLLCALFIVSFPVRSEPLFDSACQTPDGGGTTVGATTELKGFADLAWQSEFKDVKEKLKNLARSSDADERVEILMEVRNRYILVKRNDVLYRYSFYKTPLQVSRLGNHKITREEHDQIEARLFHVKVTTPLIEASRIKDKIQAIYGRNTKSTVDEKMMGVDIWELTGGLIFQWYEPFNKKAFTRNIDYLSLEMAAMIMKEYEQYFDAHERFILKKLLVQ